MSRARNSRIAAPRGERPRKPVAPDLAAYGRFLLFLLLAAVVTRSLLLSIFSIPSESMVPRLYAGDYLLVEKWRYGWSRHSFPFSLPPFAGRMGGAAPKRGDVIVFKTPGDNRTDYVKRLIGLPGDHIRMRNGGLVLNGRPVPKLRVADLLVPPSPSSPCRSTLEATLRADRAPDSLVCRYRRYRETLPGGFSYDVLDQGRTAGDDTRTFTVPADSYFLLGDNRDRSADSRFPVAEGGIGLVPADNLVGRASIILYSTDGSADWLRPWRWSGATRWWRIGERL